MQLRAGIRILCFGTLLPGPGDTKLLALPIPLDAVFRDSVICKSTPHLGADNDLLKGDSA